MHLGKPFLEDQCPLLIPTTVPPPLPLHRRRSDSLPRLAAIPEEPPVDLLHDEVLYPLPPSRVVASHTSLAPALPPGHQPAAAPASDHLPAVVYQSTTTLATQLLHPREDTSPAVSHRASTARSTLRATATAYVPSGSSPSAPATPTILPTLVPPSVLPTAPDMLLNDRLGALVASAATNLRQSSSWEHFIRSFKDPSDLHPR